MPLTFHMLFVQRRQLIPIISSPASSALVERIFSTSGKMFRPETTRLTAKFEQLVFIKCNKRIYWVDSVI